MSINKLGLHAPLNMADLEALHRFLRGEFDAEAKSDFIRLRRVPDTTVRHFLDYYRSLNASDQDALADASTLWGTLRLVDRPASDVVNALNVNPAWARWRQELLMGGDGDPYCYYSVHLLRVCLSQAKTDRAKGNPSSVPRELEDYAASIQAVKAPDLRKRISQALRPFLSAQPFNVGGGNWDYEGRINSSRIVVCCDYGGRSAQLRYMVHVQCEEPRVALERAGFEVSLGVGLGDWDFIVEENVNDSMALLAEFVAYVGELPRRLPEKCLDVPAI